MKQVIDVVGYQAVWFAAVLGAGQGLAWPGVVAAAVFAAWHFAVAAHRTREVALAVAGIGCGLLLDGSLARAGWVGFAASWPAPLEVVGAPPWILALWAVFPLTLTRSLSVLQSRPWLAALLGAFGAPMAYLGAARLSAAWTAQVPVMQVAVALGLGWAIALPVLARIARGPAPRVVATPWSGPR